MPRDDFDIGDFLFSLTTDRIFFQFWFRFIHSFKHVYILLKMYDFNLNMLLRAIQ